MADSNMKPNRIHSSSKFQAFSVTLVIFLVVCFVVSGVASTNLDVPYIHQVVGMGDFDQSGDEYQQIWTGRSNERYKEA